MTTDPQELLRNLIDNATSDLTKKKEELRKEINNLQADADKYTELINKLRSITPVGPELQALIDKTVIGYDETMRKYHLLKASVDELLNE